MSLANIITAREQEALGEKLRASGFEGAADIIDKLVEFARDEIYLLDDLYQAAQRLTETEKVVHRMYPNTATCRSGPGVIAGQAFTRHCGHSCSNGVHQEEKQNYAEAMLRLNDALEKVRRA